VIRACGLLAAAACVAPASPAHAVDRGFEQRLVRRVLAQHDLVPHTDPEGRRIDRILIVTEPVFTPEDPFPDGLNVVHWTTRAHVVRRELLFAEGDPYRREVVEESARNLRGLTILSVATAIPFRVDDPEAVGVLVLTKDVWSLRLGWTKLLYIDGTLHARGALTEMNLLGMDKNVAIRIAHDPWIDELGQSYYDRRVFGSHWTFLESLDLLFDDETGTGLAGSYALVRPFWSLDTRWAAQLSFAHDARTLRAQQGGAIARLALDDGTTYSYQYDRDYWAGDAIVAVQLGGGYKHRISLGLFAESRAYTPNASVPADRREEYLDTIRLRPERTNQLAATWLFRGTDYRTLRDVDTYAITEDFRSGPELELSAGLSDRRLGSDLDFVALSGSAGYRWVTDRALMVAVSQGAATRLQGDSHVDQTLTSSVRLVSPSSSHGRIVWRTAVELRADNRTLGLQVLGGDGALRGHAKGALRGDHAWVSNLEWRSRSWHWATYQVGYTVYWDSGAAWDEGDRPATHHGVGFGGRVLIPQVNRRLLRFDLAAPPDDPAAFRFVFAFDQAF